MTDKELAAKLRAIADEMPDGGCEINAEGVMMLRAAADRLDHLPDAAQMADPTEFAPGRPECRAAFEDAHPGVAADLSRRLPLGEPSVEAMLGGANLWRITIWPGEGSTCGTLAEVVGPDGVTYSARDQTIRAALSAAIAAKRKAGA